jgi:hypothetical protein
MHFMSVLEQGAMHFTCIADLPYQIFTGTIGQMPAKISLTIESQEYGLY